jgi:hypothetical protein
MASQFFLQSNNEKLNKSINEVDRYSSTPTDCRDTTKQPTENGVKIPEHDDKSIEVLSSSDLTQTKQLVNNHIFFGLN